MSTTLYERLGGHDGILRFIKPFYADVRQHNVIGPIFNSHIQDWNAHLAKITEFWAVQTGGPSRYGGGFAGAHMQLGIRPEHFEHWLRLWDINCMRELPHSEGAEMSAIAHRLAERLKMIVAGRSGLQIAPQT